MRAGAEGRLYRLWHGCARDGGVDGHPRDRVAAARLHRSRRRRCAAADRSRFAGADTLATTYALKCGIEALDEDFDLLICGKMAVDGDTAQIGPELAGAFDIPCVTDVSCVQSAGFTTCGSLALVHGCDAGEETVYLEMPCAMTTAKEIGQLRMPSIAGIRAAEEADVRVVSAADVNADPARCGLAGSPTQVVRSFVPDRDQTCEAVEGTASEQAAKLAKIIEGMA